ncbi:hypothetical protein MIR68_000578 [Amoeboaphelidium protococcarum]|nr:hypothetical protein MIR68_000578 [Amoeboaphelidium protococcarum]
MIIHPVFNDLFASVGESQDIKVRVYGRDQQMDDSDYTDQSSITSRYLEAEELERQSLLLPLSQVQAQRQLEFLQFVSSANCMIEVRPNGIGESTHDTVKLIKRPGASKLTHTLFHPSIYRSIQSLGHCEDGLDQLAEFLGVEKRWKAAAAYCEVDAEVQLKLENLSIDLNESSFSSNLVQLVQVLGSILKVPTATSNEKSVVIGGVMCDHSYDYCSKMDVYLTKGRSNLPSSPIYFGTELKTCTSYPDGHLWQSQSRLAQVLATMYSLNAPILLATPSQFKVFVENKDRNTIFTYPYDSLDGHSAYTASSCTDLVQRSLVKVLVILLSRFGDAKRFRKPARSQPAANSLAVQTPLNQGQFKFLDTVQKVAKKLDFSMVKLKKALTKEPAGSRVVGVPRFIIDYNNDGSPIYQEVRVAPPGIAKELMGTAELDSNQFFESTQYSPSISNCQLDQNQCFD